MTLRQRSNWFKGALASNPIVLLLGSLEEPLVARVFEHSLPVLWWWWQ